MIQGLGLTPGALPFNQTLNLFLNRLGIAERLPLYINSPFNITQNMPGYIPSNLTINKNLPLFYKAGQGSGSLTMPMIERGY